MRREKLLIADDESVIRNFLRATLNRTSLEIVTAKNGQEAIELLKSNSFDYLLTDMKMPQKTGLDVLAFAKKHAPSTIVILMTAYGSIETAVDAMKMGAFHYLIKPFTPEAIEMMLFKAREQKRLLEENSLLKQKLSHKRSGRPIIAVSKSMKRILNDLEKIANSNASVFIRGESGTGKEVIARAIHEHSKRKDTSYIKVNCAAIPETLIESEFFGYEKGAFTGAEDRKIGRFEAADGGTLLLDEVTETPIVLQPKLLRAIQEQEFERVGGIDPVKVNVRFLATSNRNMKEAIKDKIFRDDLYYRLNVVPISIPPLRERAEDIIPLAEYFLERFTEENHRSKMHFSPTAIQKLKNYPWPGNVRELANIVERTVVLDLSESIEADHIRIDHCPLPTAQEKETLKEIQTLAELEKKHILLTLKAMGDNRTKAAKELGISIRTLRNKLRLYREEAL